jgi:hypothetical protein
MRVTQPSEAREVGVRGYEFTTMLDGESRVIGVRKQARR